jgi:dienelactone hydrolase
LRRLEFALLFAAAFAVFWPVVFGVRPRRGIVAVGLSAALFAQLQLEGFRWQLIPLYLAVVGLAVGDVFFLERRFEWQRRVIRLLLGVVGLLAVGIVPTVLPVPELPMPAGPEGIGTFSVELRDRDRDELFGERPGGPREFMVQVWYPAGPSVDAERTLWTADWEVVSPAISEQMGFPSWFWNHTRFTQSHTLTLPPVADGTYPVILYSHSWGGIRANSLNQIEHLVSNGYIVIAPDHAYVASATVLEDGDVVYQDPEALPDPESVDADDFKEAATDVVATLAGDLVTLLDALDEGEDGPLAALAGSADINRLGLYGHGAGGGAAIKVCLEDERCDAVLAMDPWVHALTQRDLQNNMTRPALYMKSDDWIGTSDDALLAGIAARGTSITYSVGVSGAATTDFTMIPLMTPMASQLGIKGPIPAGRVMPIIDNYLLGFFDVYLLGTGSAQLDSISFPEASVSVFDARE